MGYYRTLKTLRERRANQDGRHDPLIRGRRHASRLPTDWDDPEKATRKDRNWKRFRPSRYRQSD